MHTHAHTNAHIHTHAHTLYIYAYTRACKCIYIYIHTRTQMRRYKITRALAHIRTIIIISPLIKHMSTGCISECVQISTPRTLAPERLWRKFSIPWKRLSLTAQTKRHGLSLVTANGAHHAGFWVNHSDSENLGKISASCVAHSMQAKRHSAEKTDASHHVDQVCRANPNQNIIDPRHYASTWFEL